MIYIVYESNTGFGEYNRKAFTSLTEMNDYLNDEIRNGVILTVRAIKK